MILLTIHEVRKKIFEKNNIKLLRRKQVGKKINENRVQEHCPRFEKNFPNHIVIKLSPYRKVDIVVLENRKLHSTRPADIQPWSLIDFPRNKFLLLQ